MRPISFVIVLATGLGLSGSTRADVVEGPPSSCPPGYEPVASHQGGFCAPRPPSNCPAGYVPRVFRETAYCEAPPAAPCPPGSDWITAGPNNGWCQPGQSCAQQAECGPGFTCRPTSLCVMANENPREYIAVASRTCSGPADCGPTERCVVESRCDPDVKRVATPGMPPPPAPVIGTRGGCGSCRIGQRPGAGPAGTFAVLLGLLAAARRLSARRGAR